MTEKESIPEGNGKEDNKNLGDEETEFESSVIKQVEYYFGDLNLPRDKFLRDLVKLDDGWVPLEVLISFNRLAKLTTDLKVIADAINKSTTGLLEVSDDNKKVRRNPELPVPEMNEDRRKELMGRTIYAKGFVKDATLDEILKFFKQFEEVENVIMRKYQEKQTKQRLFKGSVFATFKTKEQAEKFMNTEEVKYNDNKLITRWQEDYLKEKHEEYSVRKEKRDKKHTDPTTEKKDDFKLPSGTVLFFNEATEKLTRENIKEALQPLGGEIAFIDFKSGDQQGWVRYSQENAAIEVNKKITDGKVKVLESDLVMRLLEGEEEKAYLEKTVEVMIQRRKNQKNFKQNKGRNFKGKQGGGRKRRQDHDDGPPSKIKS